MNTQLMPAPERARRHARNVVDAIETVERLHARHLTVSALYARAIVASAASRGDAERRYWDYRAERLYHEGVAIADAILS